MSRKIVAIAAVAALTGMLASAASAAQITLNLGQATGGVAMNYLPGAPEDGNVSNIAYMRAQISADNPNGAAFQFDQTDLAGPGTSMDDIFSGGASQFGFDLIVPVMGAAPTLTAVDNGGAPAGNVGNMVWAVNDYKPGGPANPAATPVNSLFRSVDADPGNSLTLDTFNLVGLGGGIWTVDIAGTLISDEFIHWFNPATVDTDLSAYIGLNPVIAFAGQLTYDRALDTTQGMDFYAGTIDFTLTIDDGETSVPDAGSTAALLSLAGLGLAAVRRRFVR